jgi:hypothetical protein
MKCSHHQFVYLLKNLLVFHAMYKCGPPLFGPGSSPSDANDLLLLLHKLVAQIITYALDKRATSGSCRNSMSCSIFLLCCSSFVMLRTLMSGPERGT